MQVSIETTTGLERRMTIGVPATEIESAVTARLQEAARTVRLDGFRRGKVPIKVIKKRFGPGVRQEVLGEVMSKSYQQALVQENVKPAGQPRIEPKSMDEGKDLEFVAVFEVYPDVQLADFSAIEVEKQTAEVSDKDVDQMIETLRQQRQTWDVVKRQAKNEDKVNIDFVGTIDGEEFAGGKGENTDLVLGSGRMIEGFEKGLLKAKAGDEISLDLKFPEDYRNKELAGKDVNFAIKVNSVMAPVLPELNDEFFAVFGVEEGGEEAFRKEVAENMSRELRKASRARLKNEVMDAILAHNEVEVPEALIASEIDALRKQALQQFGQGAQNLDPSMLPDELFREQATKRVSLGLLLGEIIKQRGLRADPAKVRQTIDEIAETYETPEEVVNWYYGNNEQLAAVESAVLEDQVLDVILEQAKVNEKQVSYEELMKPKEGVSDEEGSDEKSAESFEKKAESTAAADEGAGSNKAHSAEAEAKPNDEKA